MGSVSVPVGPPTIKALDANTPRKGHGATPDLLTPTASVVSSMDSPRISSPTHSISANNLYNVMVTLPPDGVPDSGVLFFRITISNTLTGREWSVDRRYRAFDALKTELWWKRALSEVEDSLMPPKHPPPGSDVRSST